MYAFCLGTPLAAGTGRAVGLAAQLGAVGQQRLERVPVETWDSQLAERHVDGALVAGVHDDRDRRQPRTDDGHAAGSVDLQTRLHLQRHSGSFLSLLLDRVRA